MAPRKPRRYNAFLRLARCLIASRLMDETTRDSIIPPLQSLTEQVVGREVFNPKPSVESVEAIAILSLWAPVGVQACARDGRLLIASAVSMAINLRLHETIQYVLRVERQGLVEGPDAPDLRDSKDKARLVSILLFSIIVDAEPSKVACSHECRIYVRAVVYLGPAFSCEVDNDSQALHWHR